MAKHSRKTPEEKALTLRDLRRLRTPEDLADLLTRNGGRAISADAIKGLVACGAPVGKDGRVDLVTLTAWMVREASGGEA